VVRALASHQSGPGSNPGVDRRHTCVEFVVVLSFTPRGFSPGILVFPSPQKLTTNLFVDVLRLNHYFIYLFKMVNLKQPSNLQALVILSRSKVPVLS